MGVTIQQGHANAAGGGWTLISSSQPTSDVAAVTFTGLSGYSRIRVEWVLQNSNSGTGHSISFGGRVSGGTWRDGSTISGDSGAAQYVTAGSIEVNNFNDDTAVFKIGSAIAWIDAATLDNTSATATVAAISSDLTGMTFGGGIAWAWAETWDEFRINAATSDFEGSTAGQRGYVYIYGMV